MKIKIAILSCIIILFSSVEIAFLILKPSFFNNGAILSSFEIYSSIITNSILIVASFAMLRKVYWGWKLVFFAIWINIFLVVFSSILQNNLFEEYVLLTLVIYAVLLKLLISEKMVLYFNVEKKDSRFSFTITIILWLLILYIVKMFFGGFIALVLSIVLVCSYKNIFCNNKKR
jgi:hypothetical protein